MKEEDEQGNRIQYREVRATQETCRENQCSREGGGTLGEGEESSQQVPTGLGIGEGWLPGRQGGLGGERHRPIGRKETVGLFEELRPLSIAGANAAEGDKAVNVSRTQTIKGFIYYH